MNAEAARGAVVDLIVAVRATSRLRMWDQAQGRLQVAAMTNRTVEEFATSFQGKMGAQMRKGVATAVRNLVDLAGSDPLPLLRLVSREHGYIIALAQLRTEELAQAAKERAAKRAESAREGEEIENEDSRMF